MQTEISTELEKIPADQRDTPAMLHAVLTKCARDLTMDQAWVSKVAKSRNSVPKRLRWVSENDGRPIIGKPWRNKA